MSRSPVLSPTRKLSELVKESAAVLIQSSAICKPTLNFWNVKVQWKLLRYMTLSHKLREAEPRRRAEAQPGPQAVVGILGVERVKRRDISRKLPPRLSQPAIVL
jgi:hypothetical protein